MIKLYSMEHPITNIVFYVGKTKLTLQDRLRSHLHEAVFTSIQSEKCKWIKNLFDEGLIPIIRLIEECNIDDSRDREIYWMKFYFNKNPNLTNRIPGFPQKHPSPRKGFKSNNHKIEISFTDPQSTFLEQEAKRLGISIAELVRRSVDWFRTTYPNQVQKGDQSSNVKTG